MKIKFRESVSIATIIFWALLFGAQFHWYMKTQGDAWGSWIGVVWALGFCYYMGRSDQKKSSEDSPPGKSDSMQLLKQAVGDRKLLTVRQLTLFTFKLIERNENEKRQ